MHAVVELPMNYWLFCQILGLMKDIENRVDDYETLTSSLLEWIRKKIEDLNDRNFPNSLDGVQKLLVKFKQYITQEKPPKYVYRNYWSLSHELKEKPRVFID